MNLMIRRYIIAIGILSLVYSCSPKKNSETSTLNYLEQEIPGDVPMIFGEGIVSVKGRFDMGFTMSPDGKSMAFGVAHESDSDQTCIYLTNNIDGYWTDPSKSFLANNSNTFFPMFSPTGKELYFAKSIEDSETDIWVGNYVDNKVIDAQPLDSLVNSKSREAGHGLTRSGKLYFTSNRDDQNPCCGDVYFTQSLDGEGIQVQKSEVLSSEADEESLYLSPNEDFIIIQAWKNEYGSKHDLYISYRTKSGSWTEPDRLDSNINSNEIEQRPFVTADNKFLFFSRMSITNENGQDLYDSDIYWVSTKTVFSPYVYNDQFNASVNNNEDFELELPKELFKDIDGNELLYELTLKDNSKMPDWMVFDPDQLVIKGKWNTQEELQFTLTATDANGNSGEFNFAL